MKNIAILALLGYINQSQALRIQARDDTTCTQAKVDECVTQKDDLELFRYFALGGDSDITSYYKTWWESQASQAASSLAQSQALSQEFDCTMQLQNCNKTVLYLENYTNALDDPTVKGEWEYMHQLMAYAPNKDWLDWKLSQKAKWDIDNPVAPTNDGNLTQMKAEEDAKMAIPDNGDDVTGVDKNLPVISQTSYSNSCNSAYNRLLNESKGRILTQGSLFHDASFKNDYSSYDGQTTKVWKSPIEFNKYFPSLYGEQGVRPAAVNQGILGDCWLLASIAAISETPERIVKIFNNREKYAGDGKFVVQMFVAGNPIRVTIDDQLPGQLTSQEEFYTDFASKSPNGAFWAAILEKAAGKYFGNYYDLEGGMMREAFWIFTGMPTTVFRHNKDTPTEDIWSNLKDWENRNYIVASAITDGSQYGLISGHAYTLLGPFEYNGQKLIKMRNPWGKEKYNGDWSDKDTTKWTDDAKQTLSHSLANDGVFFIPIENFKSVFSVTQAALYQDWIKEKLETQWDRKTDITNLKYTFTNTKAQRVVLGVSVPSGRMFKHNKCITPERPEELLLYISDPTTGEWKTHAEGKDYQWIGSGQAWFRFENLAPGSYELRSNGQGTDTTGLTTGLMPLTVQSFAEEVAVTIS